MVYRYAVRRRVESLWKSIDTNGPEAVLRTVGRTFRFRFLGDTPLGADLDSVPRWRAWWEHIGEVLPPLRFRLVEVVVDGWPWNTRVATRLEITGTLADGTDYRNDAVQFARLRWGRMVDDVVLEDTQKLTDACRRHAGHAAGPDPRHL